MIKRKPKRVFTEPFKLSVLREYYSSGMSKYAITKKYSLSPPCIYRWLKEYPVGSDQLPLPSETKERLQMVPKQSDLTDMESLQKRIEELRRSLELEKMRSRAFEKMIEIAEEEEGISIFSCFQWLKVTKMKANHNLTGAVKAWCNAVSNGSKLLK